MIFARVSLQLVSVLTNLKLFCYSRMT
jgi:hypothetical protein